MDSLQIVRLSAIMALTEGRPEVVVGLIDGPLDLAHPDLHGSFVRELPGSTPAGCAKAQSVACTHGTYVAGILSARRGAPAPAICPNCTLLVRPVFAEGFPQSDPVPSATLAELAAAIIDCIEAGANVLNISAAPEQPSSVARYAIEEALDYACQRGVLVVAAAGNQGTLGSSTITRHRWVISVSACDLKGRPMEYSNLGASIALNGLSAPGASISTLAPGGKTSVFSGTSAAAPFVTGTAALLWSLYPEASAGAIRLSLVSKFRGRGNSIVPPLLNAHAAYEALSTTAGQLAS